MATTAPLMPISEKACSTDNRTLCANCAPLYESLHPHIDHRALQCPSLTTYPVLLLLRVHRATNPSQARWTNTISQQLGGLITTQMQTLFTIEPPVPIPVFVTQQFRPEYTDLRIMVDLPHKPDMDYETFLHRVLGVAVGIPDLGYRQEGWRVELPKVDECAQHFRLRFWDEHMCDRQAVVDVEDKFWEQGEALPTDAQEIRRFGDVVLIQPEVYIWGLEPN
ncbi:hypothetical protein BJY00DRAFT_318484 [Aspergillus carlsbadensis]|nr:hypothetical protein BJY00DRAFT_318484 [Aspergillus carlsbadensis]